MKDPKPKPKPKLRHYAGALPLNTLNELARDEFVALLCEVFEHAAWVAEGAFDAGPFESLDDLHAAMVAVMRGAGRERQLALIRAHPQLTGKAADGELTAASWAEQSSAGLDACSAEELDALRSLNAAYLERFEFPFIMAVKGRTRPQILSVFRGRLERSAAVEFESALAEIERIARFRLDALVSR